MQRSSMPFTYYGDLLGMSNYYKLDAGLAREKLNTFYDLVYVIFKDVAQSKQVSIFLFSDFIILTGLSVEMIIGSIGNLYNQLIEKDILIRGALVKGTLLFEKRIQFKNLQKRLPLDDVLFRAVSIEKKVEGMRLAIEKSLAKALLPRTWLTGDSYRDNASKTKFSINDFRRKIVLMKNWNTYEYLWPLTWGLEKFDSSELSLFEAKFGFIHPVQRLRGKLSQLPSEARKHITGTIALYRLAEERRRITHNSIN